MKEFAAEKEHILQLEQRIEKLEQENNALNNELLNTKKIIENNNNTTRNQELLLDTLNYKEIANLSPILIWISKKDGSPEFMNDYWNEFVGYNIIEPAKEIPELIHPDDFQNLRAEYLKSIAEHTKLSKEFRFKHFSGSYHWIIAKGLPLIDDKKELKGYIGTCVDIDHVKKAEKAYENYTKELKELNSTKDRLFSIIANDLKSLISGILSISSSLLESLDIMNFSEIQQSVELINDTSEQLFSLMENLLEWSNLQMNKINFHYDNYSLRSLLDKSIELVFKESMQKKVSLVNTLSTDFQVYVDKPMIVFVLKSLLLNGIKYSYSGSRIIISAIERNGYIEVFVTDKGKGLKKDEISKLFKIDVRHSTLGTEGEIGTGFSLILCKELLKKNWGDIFVSSESSIGTTFSITLPKVNLKKN